MYLLISLIKLSLADAHHIFNKSTDDINIEGPSVNENIMQEIIIVYSLNYIPPNPICFLFQLFAAQKLKLQFAALKQIIKHNLIRHSLTEGVSTVIVR